jgi:hypothetical protein
MKMPPGTANEIAELVEHIRPLLAGRDPSVQGAVLADLVSMLLAGHILPNSKERTNELREGLLQAHITAVRQLIPINEKFVLARYKEQLRRRQEKGGRSPPVTPP